MQHILVDHARRKRTAKRGGFAQRFPLKDDDRVTIADPDTLLDIAVALDRLAAEDPSSTEVARIRLFAGLNIDEAALAGHLPRYRVSRMGLRPSLAHHRSGHASRARSQKRPIRDMKGHEGTRET